MIEVFIVSIIILIAGSFSFWYASKLALFKWTSFKYAFFVTLIAYVSIGAVKAVMQITGIYKPQLVWIPILTGIAVQTALAKVVFQQSWVKTIIAVITGAVVTAIIVIPMFVVAGGVITYIGGEYKQ
jgi:hypothetical protein